MEHQTTPTEKFVALLPLTVYYTGIFVGAKLTNYLDWNWFWVFSPLVFTIILYILITMFTPNRPWWRR